MHSEKHRKKIFVILTLAKFKYNAKLMRYKSKNIIKLTSSKLKTSLKDSVKRMKGHSVYIFENVK
jgi:hypothetical protein